MARGPLPWVLVAGVVATAAIAACAGRMGPVGVSHDGREAMAEGDACAAEGGARSLAIPPDFRESMTKVNHARFVSNGHAAGRFEADVYANAAGKEALASDTGAAPAGARLVVEHFERAGASAGKTAGVMMMEKGERGDWRYVVIGSSGELVKDGALE